MKRWFIAGMLFGMLSSVVFFAFFVELIRRRERNRRRSSIVPLPLHRGKIEKRKETNVAG